MRPGDRVGQIRGVLDRCGRAAGRRIRSGPGDLPLAGADARSSRGRAAGWPARGHAQLGQCRGLGGHREAAGRRRGRCPAHLPRAPGVGALCGVGIAEPDGASRPAGHRRSALRVRLGFRLSPRLSAADPAAHQHPSRPARAGDDGDRERPRDSRRCPPTRGGQHTGAGGIARNLGSKLSAARGRPRAFGLATVRVGGDRTRPTRRIRNRLRTHRRRHRPPCRLPHRSWPCCRGIFGPAGRR